MMKTCLLVGIAVSALAARAEAGGSPNTIGVGAEAELSGLGGASVNYDAGQFHLGGFLGYDRLDISNGMGTNTTSISIFEFGGRFFYHLHSTAMSDFGLGGALDIASVPSNTNINNRDTDVFIEPGFQIRIFVASNVALSVNGGLVFGVAGQINQTAISGQVVGGHPVQILGGAGGGLDIGLTGGAGVHYYFF